MKQKYMMVDRPPTVHEYINLCKSVGWGNMNFEFAEEAIGNSVYATVITLGEEVVGMARIIGDGKMYFYFQDIAVSPDHQNRGLGKRLIDQLFTYLKKNAPSPAFIGLFSTDEGYALYEKYGFQVPSDMKGMYRLTPVE
ncbi:GNAT family N-acetyltransferase [Bacillus sp. 2205SS5-2]|uniref:GNAT family N-acetyltransferase n=1 Tax=Bacillus sp. 2205SS5-2 TaxID=3109031 RepID=UPI003005E8F9